MGARSFTPVGIPAVPPVASKVLTDLVKVPQCQPNWCWAACTVMVVRFFNLGPIEKCQLPQELPPLSNTPRPVPFPDCCGHAGNVQCNRGCDVGDVARIYDNHGVSAGLANPNNLETIIQNEIKAQHPVEVRYDIGSGANHVVLIVGFFPDQGPVTGYFIVDPEEPNVCLPPSALISPKTGWQLTHVWKLSKKN